MIGIRRFSTLLRGASLLALSAPAFAVVAAPIVIDNQNFPNGFENAQDITGPKNGIQFKGATIGNGFRNVAGVTVLGEGNAGVFFDTTTSLGGGFNNAGTIQGKNFGVQFGPGSSVSGGFVNTGVIGAIGGPAQPQAALATPGTLVDLGPNSFTPLASVITFSEKPFGTQNPVYSFTGVPEIGDLTVSFKGSFAGQTESVGFPVTLSDNSPSGPLALNPGGSNVFITNDGSNPSSPVLSGTPTFNGPISILFSKSVAAVGLSGGFFNNPRSTSIHAFDRDGNSLGIISNSVNGIEFYGLATSDGLARIAGISFYITGNEPAGFAIDNVTFGGASAVNIQTPGIGVFSEAATWRGAFVNAAGATINGLSTGVGLKGTLFEGDFENGGLIEGLAQGRQTGLSMDYQTITGNFLNKAGATIRGAITGVDIRAKQFTGSFTNNGRIKGGGANTGLHIAVETFTGAINNGAAGVLDALSKALHLEIGKLTGPVTNAGLIEATATDGVAVLFDGFGNPPIGEYLAAASNSGRIKGGSGANGKGIVINAALPQGLTNSGVIETGGLAIEHIGPGNLTFTQEGASAATRGGIAFANAGADKAIFKGGRYDGVIAGQGSNDAVEASTDQTAFASGGATGLNSFSVLSGTSLLGTAVADTNGAGFDVSATSVTLNGTVFLDDDTDIAAETVALGPNAALNLFLTTDTTKHARITSASAVDLKGTLRAFLDPLSFAGTSQRRFIYEGVITAADGFTGGFNALTASGGGGGLFTLAVEIEEGAAPLAALAAQSVGALAVPSLNVVVTRVSFADLPGVDTPNQRSLGQALETIFIGGGFGSDLSNLFDFIIDLPLDEVPGYFDQIAGSTHAETPFTFVRSDEYFKDQIRARISAVRNIDSNCVVASLGDGCFRRYAQGGPVVTDTSDPFAWLRDGLRRNGATSLWARALGVWGEREASIHAPGSRLGTGGLIAGVDHVVSQTFMAGAALQYTHTDVDFRASTNEATVEGYQAGGYFSWGDSDLYLNGNASVLYNTFDTVRRFNVGLNTVAATADYDALSVSAGVETGMVIEADGGQVQPYAGLSYLKQWVDSYRENGAGGLGLIVAKDEVQSLVSTLGLRATFPSTFGGTKITPELRAAWRHEFLDVKQTLDVAFIGAPNVPFAVRGTQAGRDTAVLGAGVTAPLSDSMVLYADYEAQISQTHDAHAVTIGLRVTW